MDLRQLTTFCTVVEAGGVTAAAERLFCVPSNVTKRIKDLEEVLGETLFIRDKGKMNITPKGRFFYQQARQLVASFNEMARTFTPGAGSAIVNLGGIDVAMDYVLPQRLPAYHALYPQVKFKVFRGYSLDLEHGLSHHDYDVIFSDGPIENPRLASTLVFREKLVLIGDDSLLEKQQGDLFVFGQSCQYRGLVDRWVAAHHIAPGTLLEVESYHIMKALVSARQGVAFVPQSMIASLQATRLVSKGIEIPCDVYAIWKKDEKNPVIEQFIAYLNQQPLLSQ